MANAVILKLGYSDAIDLLGRGISAKVNGKKKKVYLRVLCDDFSIGDLSTIAKSSNVLAIEYQGTDVNEVYRSLNKEKIGSAYIYRIFGVGSNVSLDDIKNAFEAIPEGVVPVFELPSDYKDMEKLYKLNKEYPTARFIGGTLFAKLDGCNVGICGTDILDNLSIKYDIDYIKYDNYCALDTYSMGELDLEISEKIEKPKKTSSKSESSNNSSGKKTKRLLFADLLKPTGSVSL